MFSFNAAPLAAQGYRVQGSELWWTAGQRLTLTAKPTVWLERKRSDGCIFVKLHPEHHSCADYPDSATSSIYFGWRSFSLPHRYPPPPPFWREVHSPPHVKRSHWFIWRTPSTILMGSADASSLPFKIYVPTRLAINHGTCSVGSELRQEAMSRPIHYRGFGSTSEPHPHDWLEEHQQDW